MGVLLALTGTILEAVSCRQFPMEVASWYSHYHRWWLLPQFLCWVTVQIRPAAKYGDWVEALGLCVRVGGSLAGTRGYHLCCSSRDLCLFMPSCASSHGVDSICGTHHQITLARAILATPCSCLAGAFQLFQPFARIRPLWTGTARGAMAKSVDRYATASYFHFGPLLVVTYYFRHAIMWIQPGRDQVSLRQLSLITFTAKQPLAFWALQAQEEGEEMHRHGSNILSTSFRKRRTPPLSTELRCRRRWANNTWG